MSSVILSPIGPATAAKRGTMSAAHFTKLDALMSQAALEAALATIPATTADLPDSVDARYVTDAQLAQIGTSAVEAVTEANGLDLTTGTLSLAAAGAAQAGAVTTGAQELGGVKTLTGAILAGVTTIVEATTALIRAIGVSLVLRSSLGAGASDVVAMVGTSQTIGTTNATAELFVVATDLAGTPNRRLAVYKGAQAAGFELGAPGVTGRLKLDNSVGWQLAWGTSAVVVDGSNVRTDAGVTVIHRSLAVDGASAIAVVSRCGNAWANATARLHSFQNTTTEKSAIMGNGEFEHAVAGAGIVLKSPDGTRYRITIANGGTLSIAAA